MPPDGRYRPRRRLHPGRRGRVELAAPSPRAPPVTTITFPDKCFCGLHSGRLLRVTRGPMMYRTPPYAVAPADHVAGEQLHVDPQQTRTTCCQVNICNARRRPARPTLRTRCDSIHRPSRSASAVGFSAAPIAGLAIYRTSYVYRRPRCRYRTRAGHGFQRRDSEWLVPRRGDENVRRVVVEAQLAAIAAADEVHLARRCRDRERARPTDRFPGWPQDRDSAFRRRRHKFGEHLMLGLQAGDRADDVVDAFPRHEASELQDREAIRPAEKPARIGLVHRRHFGRIESSRRRSGRAGAGRAPGGHRRSSRSAAASRVSRADRPTPSTDTRARLATGPPGDPNRRARHPWPRAGGPRRSIRAFAAEGARTSAAAEPVPASCPPRPRIDRSAVDPATELVEDQVPGADIADLSPAEPGLEVRDPAGREAPQVVASAPARATSGWLPT